MRKRRRRSYREIQTETRDRTHLAKERDFKVGDRVAWQGGDDDRRVTGVIESFDADRRFAIVKSGTSFLAWPLADVRLKYAQTPHYEEPSEIHTRPKFVPAGSEITPIGSLSSPIESDYYDALDVDAAPEPSHDTIADLMDEMTLPDGTRKTRIR